MLNLPYFVGCKKIFKITLKLCLFNAIIKNRRIKKERIELHNLKQRFPSENQLKILIFYIKKKEYF